MTATIYKNVSGSLDYNIQSGNIPIAQTGEQILSHLDIINTYHIRLFIELGMFRGGTLVHVLPNLILDNNFSYLGYEIEDNCVDKRLLKFAQENSRCEIVIGNIFSYVEYIYRRIKDAPGAVYVFCDGGNKPNELETFSPALKLGDVISVHDYVPDGTGEIADHHLQRLGSNFAPLSEEWRKTILHIPTFQRIK